jgi:hypothetical protein|tara:strand:- start:32 stop:235 length:204 start_codon:yes stop_codon:yes gene_type:complete
MLNKTVTDRASSLRYFVRKPKKLYLSNKNAAMIASIVSSESRWASLKLPFALKMKNDEPEVKIVQII